MFDYFCGFIADKRKNSKGTFLTIDVNGVGYLIETTERDFLSAENNEEKDKIYTTLIHREDAMCLYGFLNKETREATLFKWA